MAADSPEPEKPVKYSRGEHPASLANLKPFQPGHAPANPWNSKGPVLTPYLKKYAQRPLSELRDLLSWSELTAAEAVAITTLLDAVEAGIRTTGHHSRAQLFDRLDGVANKQPIEVDVWCGRQVGLDAVCG